MAQQKKGIPRCSISFALQVDKLEELDSYTSRQKSRSELIQEAVDLLLEKKKQIA